MPAATKVNPVKKSTHIADDFISSKQDRERSLIPTQPGMSQIYEEMLLRKYQPSKEELWRYKLTRPGVTVYVKNVRNVKKTMQ